MAFEERALKRLGVLGGTFDPIHLGHLVAASEVAHAWSLDGLLFVPAGSPWQRTGYSDAEDRYLMTALGIGTDRRFAVSRIEVDRPGPTYTADTLDVLRGFYGAEIELFVIVGADAASRLDTWEGRERIAEKAEVIVVSRSGSDIDAGAWHRGGPTIRVHEMPAIDISGTQIRERVARGEPIDYLVPAPVADYIKKRGLYIGRGVADAS